MKKLMQRSYWLHTFVSKYFDRLDTLRRSVRRDGVHLDYRSAVRGSRFEGPNRVMGTTEVRSCTIGRYTYFASGSRIYNADIGRFGSFGPNVLIGQGLHPSKEYLSTSPAFYSTSMQCGSTLTSKDTFEENKRTRIGNDVWIGAQVFIVDGVYVGDGSIVAAGSVVTKDVEPYSIVGGSPAKLIRQRFSESVVSELLEIKWWQSEPRILQQAVHSFGMPSGHDAMALVQELRRALV